MKHSIIGSLLFIIAIFAGCESPDVISLPHQEQRLVVNGVGYAGFPWRVDVTLSEDVLYADSYKDILDAKVSLYENGVLAEKLNYTSFTNVNGTFGWYEGDSTIKPKPGNVYKITVEHSDYPTVEAEYKQPEVVEIQHVEIKEIGFKKVPYRSDGYEISASVEFDDPSGENFYEILAVAKDAVGTQSNVYLSFVDPAYKEYNDLYSFKSIVAIDDRNFNGQSVRLELSGIRYIFGSFNPTHYTIYIRNLSKEYYEYYKTTTIQNKTSEDPFAQPILIYNNIVNGYGLFAGFTESSKTVPINN